MSDTNSGGFLAKYCHGRSGLDNTTVHIQAAMDGIMLHAHEGGIVGKTCAELIAPLARLGYTAEESLEIFNQAVRLRRIWFLKGRYLSAGRYL